MSPDHTQEPLLARRTLESPIGHLSLFAGDEGLELVLLPEQERAHPRAARDSSRHPVLEVAVDELRRYFAGEPVSFVTPLAARGTAFQQATWAALRLIPYGARRSYAEIAASIGRPAAVRAVGAANGRNPLPLLVPCHRVIGSDGSLTGYAGGLAAKRWLLEHEARHARQSAA